MDAVTLDLGMPGRARSDRGSRPSPRRAPKLAAQDARHHGQHLDSDCVERLARCGAGVLAKPFTLDHLQDASAPRSTAPATRAEIDRIAGALYMAGLGSGGVAKW